MLINTKVKDQFYVLNRQTYFRLYNLLVNARMIVYNFYTMLHIVFTILFFFKFKSFNRVVKFIGKSRPKRRRKRRRKHWVRRFKKKVPYFYLKSVRKNKVTLTYNNIKLYKLF